MGRETYLQCIRPQDVPTSADRDLPPGAGCSIVQDLQKHNSQTEQRAAGIV